MGVAAGAGKARPEVRQQRGRRKQRRVGVDLVQADMWFRLAARSPYHDNSQIRGAIEPKMTSDQINAAQRQVDAWRRHSFAELKTLPIALPARPGAQAGLCLAME